MKTPEHFDAIVVGSGFGGAVMAYRLAEAGLRVCVLERGKRYPPGSFPRQPAEMRSSFWDPNRNYHGLFDVWSFRHLEAVTASGLGGGSLIYANVLLRKDEAWFVQEDLANGGYEYWPVTRAELDPHYDEVERHLGAQPYPFEHAPFNQTPKTIAFHEATSTIGLEPTFPNLAISFRSAPDKTPVPGEYIHNSHHNIHNHPRFTCRLCGECDIGCNYGSKNTLDFTYLSAAQRHGAEIRTLCEVRVFKPRDGGGYSVDYIAHHPDPKHEGRRVDIGTLPLQTITADQLILAAGTLGTTYLMLKSQPAFPRLSRQLGTRFCGNGDYVTFARRCVDRSNERPRPRNMSPSYGPVITSSVRVGGAEDGLTGRGFYIQDAGIPEFATWMVQMIDMRSALYRLLMTVGPWLINRMVTSLTGRLDSNVSAEMAAFFGECSLSSGSLPLLGMGRDFPDGTMRLLNDQDMIDVDWRKDRSRDYFGRVRATMEQIATALGGEFVRNPLSLFQRVITVHPLGGCPMGRNPNEGVVDAYGEVFGYEGLYVADGAVMPGPVGPNPSLTIAALADRFADKVIERHRQLRRSSEVKWSSVVQASNDHVQHTGAIA